MGFFGRTRAHDALVIVPEARDIETRLFIFLLIFSNISYKVNPLEIALPSGRTSASFPGSALRQLLATLT